MPQRQDSIDGNLILKKKVPNNKCYPPNLSQLLEFIVASLAVEFSANVNLDLVVVGSTVPDADQSGKPWFRTDVNGNPLGWYTYIKGAWKKAYTQPVNQVTWLFNLSPATAALIPEGFVLANGVNNTPDLTSLFQGTAPNWTYYAVIYRGY